MSWEPVIGLEIHVQLKTRTKMFCRCENGFGEPPNTRTCPVCLAHPGALPVPNRAAVEWTVKLGLALGCEIAARAVFHRKNYFYPDLPEGLPDLPVRRAALRRRALRRARARTATSRSASSARTSRRTRRRPSTSAARAAASHGAETLARRLQPRRHAARRDRHAARPPLGRRGAALPPAPAPDGRRARHLGRGDGEGLAALRRERLGAPGRRGRASARRLGAEEHELVQLRRPRDRARRSREQIALLRGRGRGRPGDATTSTPVRRRSTPPLARRRRRRTTATSPSPTSSRRAASASSSSGCAAELPELPGARIRRLEARGRLRARRELVTTGRDRALRARSPGERRRRRRTSS